MLLRRRGKPVLRLSSVEAAHRAAGSPWRRHVPPALFLGALSALLLALALARPAAPLTLPWTRSTIMLAMDVSLNMRVRDVQPTRMVAAQEAARTFLQELPRHIEVGLVTFAGSAQVARQATLDRPLLIGAIDAMQMQMGTAVGSAIVLCLAELFPDHGLDLAETALGPRRNARSLDDKDRPPPQQITPVAPGSYDSAVIILLSDGRRTTGVDTLEAAKLAADRGVRIHVVGLGTVDGHASAGEGMAIYLQLDEPTQIGTRVQVITRETELTAVLAWLAAVLVVAASSLSLLWFGRIA